MIQVLLVDDEPFVRRGMIQTIPWQKYGLYIAGEAGDGLQALEFVRNKQVDLLFVDLSMPTMSGLELIRKLKDEFPEKSSVILTCHQDFQYAQEAVRLGALDYIVKTQMTRDNIDQILESIVMRYKVHQENIQAKQNISVHSEKIRKLWINGDWIFSDAAEAIDFIHSAELQAWLAPYSLLPSIFTIPPEEVEKSWNDWLIGMKKQLRSAAENNSTSEEVCKCVWKALLHMILNYGSHMNQSDLSREFGMNRSYFSQVFAAMFKRPFNVILRDIRMKSAEQLLVHRQQPIYWIAKEVGYQDEKYFSRIFREQTGYLPSEYRELKRDSTF